MCFNQLVLPVRSVNAPLQFLYAWQNRLPLLWWFFFLLNTFRQTTGSIFYYHRLRLPFVNAFTMRINKNHRTKKELKPSRPTIIYSGATRSIRLMWKTFADQKSLKPPPFCLNSKKKTLSNPSIVEDIRSVRKRKGENNGFAVSYRVLL